MSTEQQPSTPALFEPNPQPVTRTTTTEVAVARAAQEIQASMVIAKKFPRDNAASFSRIMTACQRPSLAEVACYAYPRGGTTVTGPSIRLAECLAQNWGNLDFGIVELDQRDGESQVMAYAWDLETNTRQTKVFTVKHERRVGKGENFRIDVLKDPRDIYEMVANQGARRVRACILGVIPGDVIDAAVEACEKTLKEGGKNIPIQDRARKMVVAFTEMGVTQGMIEQRLGHKVDAISEQELVNLRRIFTSLKDGAAKREDFFQVEATKPNFGEEPSQKETAEKPSSKARGKSGTNMPEVSGVIAAIEALCQKYNVTEAEVIAFVHRTAFVEESLASFKDVEFAAPEKLLKIKEEIPQIATSIKANAGKGLL